MSGVSFKLYTANRTAGALNLFAFKPNAFDGESETFGTILAAHAAAAILASREGEELQSALSTRDRIGQAKGIIMERYNVDDVRAFEMLRKLSQDSNTRLSDIAAASHRHAGRRLTRPVSSTRRAEPPARAPGCAG